MIYKEFEINEEGSLPGAKLTVYIQELYNEISIEKRPLVLLCPGGGYAYTSNREAEPIAMAFMAKGYSTAILRYSCYPAHYPTALLELGRAMLIIREHAGEWHVDSDAIVLQGCSAGGHLAANFACTWREDFFSQKLLGKCGDQEKELFRPNGLILCYPVITSGEHAHRDSFVRLLGDRYDELLEKVSLENAVNEGVPRTFMWHTYTDQSVPVENSLLFAIALKKYNINTELHIFPEGCHGLALASNITISSPEGKELVPSAQPWIDLATTWMKHYGL